MPSSAEPSSSLKAEGRGRELGKCRQRLSGGGGGWAWGQLGGITWDPLCTRASQGQSLASVELELVSGGSWARVAMCSGLWVGGSLTQNVVGCEQG